MANPYPHRTPSLSPASRPVAKKRNSAKKTTPTNARPLKKQKPVKPSAAAELSSVVRPKVRRFRPGTVVLRTIKKLQKGTELLIPRARFVKILSQNLPESWAKAGNRMRREAVMALQEGVEASMLNFLENSNLAALHGKRVTVMPKDMTLIRRLVR
eukprot:CAMPEP_0201496710 /NCGR_PEP_ID=MMETSP0151_2-20130828/61181_1 /ASSEMBLY_ACC=CAM_ASM_000257 /TAXON_ID=200890 /ORGANISM="Paramoeba atlantica, Strain 621/1 / CCAP 1560/9" /LENGTH=155 /DNA_ID=CAMNT_0047886733 /DNA_START=30 /DNA_END=497 /DNA_ORIENTATION=+